jgi:hypothetical protein
VVNGFLQIYLSYYLHEDPRNRHQCQRPVHSPTSPKPTASLTPTRTHACSLQVVHPPRIIPARIRLPTTPAPETDTNTGKHIVFNSFVMSFTYFLCFSLVLNSVATHFQCLRLILDCRNSFSIFLPHFRPSQLISQLYQ